MIPRPLSKHPLACALMAVTAAGLMSCLGMNDSDKSSPRKSASVRLIPVMEPTQERALARRVGNGTEAGLESFQVAIEAIFLTRDITLTGSGWTNPQGYLGFYEARDLMTPDHSLLTPANALNPAYDHFFVDFMTAAGRERIANTATFTEAELGEYNFVVVNWAYPFRVRAAVDLGDGHSVYTKPGVYDSAIGGSVSAADMLTGPAETAVAVKPNGGTWFRLLRPLTLTSADLNTTTLVHDTTRRDSAGHVIDTLVPAGQLNVMLVFNPDGFLTGWDEPFVDGGGVNHAEIQGPGGVGNIHVPFLDASVIAFRTGEEVWRESYLFTGEDPGVPGFRTRTRVEIYSVGDNVVSASVRGLVGPDGEPPMESTTVFFAEAGAGGTLELQSHDHTPIVGGLHRLSTVGAAGTADLTLGHLHLSGCAFTMTEKRRMN
jgi:hypothetical protein